MTTPAFSCPQVHAITLLEASWLSGTAENSGKGLVKQSRSISYPLAAEAPRRHATLRMTTESSITQREQISPRVPTPSQSVSNFVQPHPALAPVQSYEVPGLPNWRYAGPHLDDATPRALPTVVYFALTAEQSLELPPFNEFVRFVLCGGDLSAAVADNKALDDSKAPIRVFSVTLPYHGTMEENERALREWAKRYAEGADVIRYFTRKTSEALNELVARGHVDTSRVYSVGLSRGGLLAAHFAIRNEHVSTVLGFSPVTVPTVLSEFRDVLESDEEHAETAKRLLNEASLLSDKCVENLSHCAVRVYSGNADTRVGTRNCFDLIARLAECASAHRVRSPPHEYIMYCSLGRDGHGTSTDVFAVGARWLLRRAGLRS